METKYTKSNHSTEGWSIAVHEKSKGTMIVVHAHPRRVATCYYQAVTSYPTQINEAIANAKLISAAPDLLEALLIMCEDNGYDLNAPIEGFSHRTQKVIKAIRKATI